MRTTYIRALFLSILMSTDLIYQVAAAEFTDYQKIAEAVRGSGIDALCNKPHGELVDLEATMYDREKRRSKAIRFTVSIDTMNHVKNDPLISALLNNKLIMKRENITNYIASGMKRLYLDELPMQEDSLPNFLTRKLEELRIDKCLSTQATRNLANKLPKEAIYGVLSIKTIYQNPKENDEACLQPLFERIQRGEIFIDQIKWQMSDLTTTQINRIEDFCIRTPGFHIEICDSFGKALLKR